MRYRNRLFVLGSTILIALIAPLTPRLYAFQTEDVLKDGASEATESTKLRLVDTSEFSIAWSENNDKLRGFSKKKGSWSNLEIERQERIVPVVYYDSFGFVKLKNAIAAYSPVAGRWDVVDISAEEPNKPFWTENSMSVQTKDHLYTFSVSQGLWTSPTDPEFQRGRTIYQLSNKEISPIVRERFDVWINALPANRVIRVMSSSMGNFTIETERQSLLKEAEAKLKEIEAEALKTWKPSDVKGKGKVYFAPKGNTAPANDIATAEESIQKRQAEYREFEEGTLQWANKLRKAKEIDSASREKLSNAVKESFDARQSLQMLQAKRARMQLDLVDEQIAARQKNRDQIVSRRVDEMLDPNGTSVSWFNSLSKPDEKLEVPFIGRSDSSKLGGIATNKTSESRTMVRPNSDPSVRPSAPASDTILSSPSPKASSDFSEKLHSARNAYFEATERLRKIGQELSKTHPLYVKSAESLNLAVATALNQWKQVWSAYQSQGRLLKLDVDEAKIERDVAKSAFESVRTLEPNGHASSSSTEIAHATYRIADIAVTRAEEVLSSFEELEKLEPNLNPASIEKEKKD